MLKGFVFLVVAGGKEFRYPKNIKRWKILLKNIPIMGLEQQNVFQASSQNDEAHNTISRN